MPSSTHRSKRPYQPSITSFFVRVDQDNDDTSVALNGSNQNFRQAFPTLPPTVQASLINVGMRVRKSVGEGYKTHKQLSHQPLISSSLEQTNKNNMATPPVYNSSRPGELVPFCGLHKVGGLAAQSEFAATHQSHPTNSLGELVQENDFQLSQDSVFTNFSTDSMPTQYSYKRRFDDSIGGDLDDNEFRSLGGAVRMIDEIPTAAFTGEFFEAEHVDTNILSGHTSNAPSRVIAKPKTRMKVPTSPQIGISFMQSKADNSLDFGEATFLHPDGAEDSEVEMGGI